MKPLIAIEIALMPTPVPTLALLRPAHRNGCLPSERANTV